MGVFVTNLHYPLHQFDRIRNCVCESAVFGFFPQKKLHLQKKRRDTATAQNTPLRCATTVATTNGLRGSGALVPGRGSGEMMHPMRGVPRHPPCPLLLPLAST